MPSASASRTSTGNSTSAPKLVTSLQRAAVQVERLTLRPDQAGVEERQRVAADLHPVAGSLEAGDDVARCPRSASPGGVMLDHTRSRLSVEVGIELAVVRDAVREDVAHRHLERDREDVEAGEHVLGRRPARAWNAAEVVAAQVDQVEDALLVELIGIVELPGDDPPAVRRGCG